MVKHYRVISKNDSVWLWPIILSIITVIFWFLIGMFLASDRLDNTFFDSVKILHKTDVLGYLTVVFAIQIPLFILFLERMTTSGYINRKILPWVTNFREILILMSVGSMLVLISPRESFLYEPVFILSIVNFFAIYRASTVIFQPEKFENKVRQHLGRTVNRSFSLMINRRKDNNEFREKLSGYTYIKDSFMDKDPVENMILIEMRAPNDGYVESIDLDNISQIFLKELDQVRGSINETSEQKTEQSEFRLRVQPFTTIKANSVLAKIVVPISYEKKDKLRRQMTRAFHIVPNGGADIRWLDDLIGEFEEQLNKAIDKKDTRLLNQTFDLLQVFLNQVDEFVKSNQDDDYILERANDELSRFLGDELSSRLNRLYEILADLITKSVRDDQLDINREMVRFIYKNLYDEDRSGNITSIARYDRLALHTFHLFIFSNSWNSDLSSSQKEFRDYIAEQYKEHTDLLFYKVRKLDEDIQWHENMATTRQWFVKRVSDIRELTLPSYKNDHMSLLESFSRILERIDSDRYERELDEPLNMIIKCNIFMLAAYVSFRGDKESAYSKKLKSVIMRWNVSELTSVFMECINKDYAQVWRIDMYDQLADGVMRDVPNYTSVTKKLWVGLMLAHSNIIDTVDYYGDKRKFESTTLFTESLSDDKNNSILNSIESSTNQNADKLASLVRVFIDLRRSWEASKLASERLDTEKVNEYVSSVLKAYEANSLVGKLFGEVVDKTRKEKDFIRNGVNQVFDKEAFIGEWHIGFITEPMAEQLGRNIAENQDRYVFSKLLKSADPFVAMKDLITHTRKRKDVDWLIVTNGVRQWDISQKLTLFIDKRSDYDSIYIKGVKQSMPIHEIYTDDIPYGMYFIDSGRLGVLTVKEQNADPPVRVEIDAYSDTKWLFDGLMKQAPEWLTQKGTEEVQKKFLRSKVRLLVERVFKYKRPTDTEVLFFKIDDAV